MVKLVVVIVGVCFGFWLGSPRICVVYNICFSFFTYFQNFICFLFWMGRGKRSLKSLKGLGQLYQTMCRILIYCTTCILRSRALLLRFLVHFTCYMEHGLLKCVCLYFWFGFVKLTHFFSESVYCNPRFHL